MCSLFSVFTLFYLILENMSNNVRNFVLLVIIWHLWRHSWFVHFSVATYCTWLSIFIILVCVCKEKWNIKELWNCNYDENSRENLLKKIWFRFQWYQKKNKQIFTSEKLYSWKFRSFYLMHLMHWSFLMFTAKYIIKKKKKITHSH